MIRRLFAVILVGLALITGGVTSVVAQDALDRIISEKKIRIGVGDVTPPYGMLDANLELVGFDIDVAKQLAKDLGVEAELIVVTAPNRIPALLTNQVDLVVFTLLLTPERSAVIHQSIPYMSFDTVVIASADKEITGYDDLRNYRVGIPRGTFQDTIMSPNLEGSEVQRFDDDVAARQALFAGQIDASAFGKVVVKQIIDEHPEANYEQKFVVASSYGTVGGRRTDPDLMRWVNAWIFHSKTNGYLASLHRKWLDEEMPNLPAF